MSLSLESSPSHTAGGTEMSEGLMDIMKPAIERLDAQILATRSSQYTLYESIKTLADCKLYLADLAGNSEYEFFFACKRWVRLISRSLISLEISKRRKVDPS